MRLSYKHDNEKVNQRALEVLEKTLDIRESMREQTYARISKGISPEQLIERLKEFGQDDWPHRVSVHAHCLTAATARGVHGRFDGGASTSEWPALAGNPTGLPPRHRVLLRS